ncbi:MAG: hypothetical protein ABJH82_01230 [Polaribacter sp.]|uniref:hypothetical protein n=1 Tax=Polaribacter sp. TaxID=1920175 RepID=UPI00326327D4
MRKLVILLVFTLTMSSSLFAQKNIDKKVNAYVETIESKIQLSSKEKETLKTLKVAHMKATSEISKNYEKGTPELKEKRKENNKKFTKALTEAFGKEKAKEITSASKKKKKKKKKN